MPVSLDDYRPFDTGLGSQNMAADWRKWMSRTHETGIIATHKEPEVADEFEPYADSTGMQVKIKPGECYIQGHWGALQFDKTLAIPEADATRTRIDRVVLRGDYVSNHISLEVLTGAPGSGEPPPLTYSLDRWEVRVCQVTVNAGVATITASSVKDERERVGYGMTSAHHVPVLRYSTGGTVNMGTGASWLCRYRRDGHLLYIRWYFRWGTGGYNGGTGAVTTNLPDGMTARGEYWLTSHLWTTSGGNRDWVGQSLIHPGQSVVWPYFPAATNEMRVGAYCIGAGGGHPQSPALPAGQYPEGGALTICGVLEVDFPAPVIPAPAPPSGGAIGDGEEPGTGTEQPITRVSTYPATWSASWNRVGKRPADSGLYQGSGPNGYEFGKVGFDAASISAELADADEITKVELYLRNDWAQSPAGFNAMLGTHENTNEPGPNNGLDQYDRAGREWFNTYQAKWVELPLTWGTEFQAHTTKGITIGHTVLGGAPEFAYFNRSDDPPRLRFTYRK